MIAGHTRTLRDTLPLPPAIKISRRVSPPHNGHTTATAPDQLPARNRAPRNTTAGHRRHHAHPRASAPSASGQFRMPANGSQHPENTTQAE